MKTKRRANPFETFSPQEFETFLGAVRPDWLAWLGIGGLAGIRTDGEIFRTNWNFLNGTNGKLTCQRGYQKQ